MNYMKDKNFLIKNLIAHCGLHDIKNGVVENSLKAFELAIKKGYTIELDLHILKDNTIVVFHDNNLEKMTGVNKKISKCTYNQIKNLKLRGTKNYIPLFKDVLSLVNGKVPLLIELKYDTRVGRLEKSVMEELRNYNGKYAIHSFNPLSILFLKYNFPNIVRGQISSNFDNVEMNFILKFLLKNMYLNALTKPDFISYDISSLPNKRVERYRKDNLVLGWTIKDKEDLQKAKKYCDNYICENIL